MRIPTRPASRAVTNRSVRSVYWSSGKAVLRLPVRYSSAAAVVARESTSRLLSRCTVFSIRSRSVTPSTQATDTLVAVWVPTTSWVKRSFSERIWRRIKPVLMRIFSLNASFAPLTVFSTWGAPVLRLTVVLASKARAVFSPGNKTRANPLSSLDRASAPSVTRTQTAL